MTQWVHYPHSVEPDSLSLAVVDVFKRAEPEINSQDHTKSSNEVLAAVAIGLESLGFVVESGKKQSEKIHVPVLYGRNGKIEKAFEADAYNRDYGYVIEVEAGRAVVNNQFLKDLFQACMMHGVRYLAVAVRSVYLSGAVKKSVSRDFERVAAFFDTLYASNRLQLPLKGILLIGY